MFISVHPEHTNKREREPAARKRERERDQDAGCTGGGGGGGGAGGGSKRRKGETRPRARLFDPAMQRWFGLGGDTLPHPERLELLTHPQAVSSGGGGGGGSLAAPLAQWWRPAALGLRPFASEACGCNGVRTARASRHSRRAVINGSLSCVPSSARRRGPRAQHTPPPGADVPHTLPPPRRCRR